MISIIAPAVKTNFYVDAFNLYYGALKGTPHKWLDLAALFGRVFPRNEIHRIRYFTARVENRPPDFRQPERQAAYFRALETIPNLSIHYGQYRTRPTQMLLAKPRRVGPRTVRVLKTEEKGSDVNLASYLLLDAFRGDCDVAVVVSNDADLKTPIELAIAELGIQVGVLNPHPPKKRSLDLRPTFFKQLRRGPIEASQFEPILSDGQGEIRRPDGW
ncbi:MAG TPA: NYN domain-containing protein [Solirubrobacterales bacterium]|nr:NYN domain-containing protein [Solirubrobacterales bacterium]